ncbi:MAG: TRAP transporter substrate-binding protein [Gammaproteobacteria bacterium]
MSSLPTNPVARNILFACCLLVSAGGYGAESGAAELRVTSLSFPESPWHDLWLRFGERLRENDTGAFDLQMFIAGELGSEETALSNIRRGRVQIGGFSLQGLATVVPELSLLLAPYLFETPAQVDFVIDNYVTEAYQALFRDKGLALLQWSEVGWLHVYAKKPLATPTQARGLAMRASNALGSRYFAEAIGADLIPVTFSEIIPSLQTGLIESGQGGVGLYALAGIAKEAKYLNMTYHAFDTGLIVANLEWFEALDAAERALIINSMDEVNAARVAIRASIQDIENRLPAQGVTLNFISDDSRQLWREASVHTHQQMVQDIGGDAQRIYALIQQGKAEFEGR